MEANQISCLKLVWRILSSRNFLWVKWVNRYLIRKASFWTVKDSSSLGSWMWKKLLKCRAIAETFSKVEVHNGMSTSFWFDDWSALSRLVEKTGGGGTMRMGIRRHAIVAMVLNRHRGKRHRVEIYNLIEQEIQNIRNRGVQNEEDVRLWKCGDGCKPDFSTKQTWKIVRGVRTEVDWAKGVWFQYNTPKFSFYSWVAILNRLPTGDRLSLWNGGITVLCSLCKVCPESRNHLFFQCQYSEEVWSSLTKKLLKTNYTNVWEDIVPLLTKKRSKLDMFLVRYVFQASLYAIWKERNGRRFGEDHKPASGLIKLIDKQVRNRISSMDHRRFPAYQGAMRTWFSSR